MVVSGSRKRWYIGGIFDPPIGRKNTTYIPLIVLAEPGGWKMLRTTFYGNQKQPLIKWLDNLYFPVVSY